MANSHLNPVLLSAYIDDEVSAEERTLVESHLVTCETCQVELDALRWTATLFHQLPDVPLPRNFYVTEAMLEEPASAAKKGWIEWLQSLFNGWQPLPIGMGAAFVALLLFMVVVQPFSTASEPQIALAPLATAPLANEEAPALAVRPEPETEAKVEAEAEAKVEAEESAAISDDFVIEEAEVNKEEASGEAAAGSFSEDHALTEEESEVLFEAILAADEAETAPQQAEATRPARPQRAVGATATVLEQIEQAAQAAQATEAEEPLNSEALNSTPDAESASDSTQSTEPASDSTDSTESASDSTQSTESAADSTDSTELAEASEHSPPSSPIASAAEASSAEQSPPPSETDLLSPQSDQSGQMILIVIGLLLLLIFGAVYWRKQSD